MGDDIEHLDEEEQKSKSKLMLNHFREILKLTLDLGSQDLCLG